MTRLEDALAGLGRSGEWANAGTWVTMRGDRCLVYVVETSATTYLTWCGSPGEHTVELYHTPKAALQAGLRRAAHAG